MNSSKGSTGVWEDQTEAFIPNSTHRDRVQIYKSGCMHVT